MPRDRIALASRAIRTPWAATVASSLATLWFAVSRPDGRFSDRRTLRTNSGLHSQATAISAVDNFVVVKYDLTRSLLVTCATTHRVQRHARKVKIIMRNNTLDIKIEKGVPIPTREHKWVHLLKQMNVTDSVVVESASQRAMIAAASKTAGVKLLTRKEGNRFRAWRVK